MCALSFAPPRVPLCARALSARPSLKRALSRVFPPMRPLLTLQIKENGFTTLDCSVLPTATLAWLIATDNAITSIPHLGKMHAVRKLMLSHNRLTAASLAASGTATSTSFGGVSRGFFGATASPCAAMT